MNINGLTNFTEAGYGSISEASEKINQQTIEANVRSAAEKNLKICHEKEIAFAIV